MNLRERLISRSSSIHYNHLLHNSGDGTSHRAHTLSVKTYDFASSVFAVDRTRGQSWSCWYGGHWQTNNKRSRYCDVEVGGKAGKWVGMNRKLGRKELLEKMKMKGVSCQPTQRSYKVVHRHGVWSNCHNLHCRSCCICRPWQQLFVCSHACITKNVF